ncbi:RDD family protein [Lysobacter xanthus]
MASTYPARPNIGWRLLALVYDVFPALGLWFVTVSIAVALHGGEPVRSGTAAGFVELAALWAVTGIYATLSWRRGGQTLGMRPWRLHVVGDRGALSWRDAWLRYAVGTLSLLAAGLGFWWAWIDRDRRAWHDRASRSRVERRAKT